MDSFLFWLPFAVYKTPVKIPCEDTMYINIQSVFWDVIVKVAIIKV